MRRLFWLGIGATVGVLVVRRVTKKVEAFTPKGIAASLGGLGEAVREFGEDVRAAMSEREEELLDALGVDPDSQAGETPEQATTRRRGR